MAGYNTILEVRRLEAEVDKLGFMFAHSRHNYNNEFGDVVALKPKDKDSLPIYARDAEMFVGTLKDLQYWLKGVEWARQYDCMLKVSDENKRAKKEDQYRHGRMIDELKKDHSNVEA